MLTTEELRTEVYKRHHKRLGADDPIFMTVTINELLLADYLEQCRAMQEVQLTELHKQSLTVMDECEKIGTALINRSLVAMQQNYEAKEKAFIERFEQANSDFLEEVRSAQLYRQPNQRLRQILIYFSIASCCFGLGFLWH
jgi:hypothetical protein